MTLNKIWIKEKRTRRTCCTWLN